jgi:hypothetical protein
MKKISTAPEFAGASMFSVDVITKIDTGSADGSDGCIGIFKCPPHLSRTQFHEFVDKASSGFGALPTMQKNCVKQIMVRSSPHILHDMTEIKKHQWIQNDTIEKDVQAMGIPAAETVAVFMVQAVRHYPLSLRSGTDYPASLSILI